MNKVKIRGGYIKLCALLKFIGEASTGGEADILISQGMVLLNGKECLVRGKKVYNGDTVLIDGREYEILSDSEE